MLFFAVPRRLPFALRLALAGLFFISIEVSGWQAAWYVSHGPIATDLRIFMTGVELVRSGNGSSLYRFDAQKEAQNRLYPETRKAGYIPYNHLAYELLLYWPLVDLPYRTALLVWAALNLVVLTAIALRLYAYAPAVPEASRLPMTVWLLAFYPIPYVLAEGQDSLLFLALVVLSLHFAELERFFFAGLVLALACFKFHLTMLLAGMVFVVRGKWGGIAGFVLGVAVAFGISRWIVGENFVSDYVFVLRNQEQFTPWGFVPRYMPNLRGFLQWTLGDAVSESVKSTMVLGTSALVAAVSAWVVWRHAGVRSDREIYALAILTAVLISYHLHMQDLSMAAFPMLLLLDTVVRERVATPRNLVIVAGVGALYLFRPVCEFVPALLSRGCVLTIPVLLLWLAALRPVPQIERAT